MALDEDINHRTVGNWSLDGIRPEVEKIDNYTIKFTFPKPNPTIVKSALSWWQSINAGILLYASTLYARIHRASTCVNEYRF